VEQALCARWKTQVEQAFCARRKNEVERALCARRKTRDGARVPVRLKACLIGEVQVLFRHTLSGL